MAKKKGKKKNSNLNLITVFIAVVFGLASTAMIFASAFKGVAAFDLGIVQGSNEISFSGLQAAFGYAETKEAWGSTITTEILSANFFSLMAYALPIISAVVLILFKDTKLFNYICAGGFIASAVFAFLSVTTFPGTIVLEFYTAYDYTLGVGSILCGAFSLIAGLATLYKIIVLDK